VTLITDAVENRYMTGLCVHSDVEVRTSSGCHSEEERRPKMEDVVPQGLLDQYLSMTNPSLADTVDTEIAKPCAYSLPGVALILGRNILALFERDV
jgi:serine/threonine-protein phosphatase 4 regulatory subunit 1